MPAQFVEGYGLGGVTGSSTEESRLPASPARATRSLPQAFDALASSGKGTPRSTVIEPLSLVSSAKNVGQMSGCGNADCQGQEAPAGCFSLSVEPTQHANESSGTGRLAEVATEGRAHIAAETPRQVLKRIDALVGEMALVELSLCDLHDHLDAEEEVGPQVVQELGIGTPTLEGSASDPSCESARTLDVQVGTVKSREVEHSVGVGFHRGGGAAPRQLPMGRLRRRLPESLSFLDGQGTVDGGRRGTSLSGSIQARASGGTRVPAAAGQRGQRTPQQGSGLFMLPRVARSTSLSAGRRRGQTN